MEPDETRLLLKGAGGKFVIGADFWMEIVDWAFERELISECTARCHRSEDGNPFEVSSEEAGRLAEAFDIIGGDLIIQSDKNVSEKFINELADALLTLQRFAESGGFRVEPLGEPSSKREA